MKILIADDDPRLRDLVALALQRAAFTVITASDGASTLMHAARESPDLIVLDIGMPEMDGFEVCRRIRATSQVPILFLTARDDEIDRIVGLELGADDYVTKPFSPRELVARVRAILKRTNGSTAPQLLRHGRITLDRAAHLCGVDGTDLGLTGMEFQLMALLLAAPGRMHPKTRVVDAIWGPHSQVSDRTLDSHLRNLRHKLDQAGLPDAIETLHGVGVKLGPCA
ncbi:MAG: response regulator transcription factor [Paracoccaceae bacterium]